MKEWNRGEFSEARFADSNYNSLLTRWKGYNFDPLREGNLLILMIQKKAQSMRNNAKPTDINVQNIRIEKTEVQK